MTRSQHQPANGRAVSAWIAIVYLLLFIGVAAGAVSLWRLRCEGFGCSGIGIAWMAWGALLYAPVACLGLVVRLRPSRNMYVGRALRVGVWLQLALGAGLLAYWAFVFRT